MTTIYDIAKRCGVSIATVSRALNGHTDVSDRTKARILAVCKELSYRPTAAARGLSLNRSWSIGVYYENQFTHPLFQEVLSVFKNSIERSEYELLFLNSHGGDTRLDQVIARAQYRNVDGMLILSLVRKERYNDLLNHSGIPCVAINLDLEGPRAKHIISDNYGGTMQAMQYLFEQGHRHIGLIGQRDIKAGFDRCQGYIDYLHMLQLPVRQEWMTYGGFWEVDGYVGARTLLDCRERPTAVFCVSDMQAIGAMQAFEDAGLRIGDDISIVGFDDIMLAKYIKPGITTVRQDKRKLGELAAEKMIQLIEGTGSPESEVVPTDLVIRGSVGRFNPRSPIGKERQ